MNVVSFPFNPQALARRRSLATEIEAAKDDLEAFGIHPAQIHTLEQLGRTLVWLDAKAHAHALVERTKDPTEIVREALSVRGEPWPQDRPAWR